MVLVAVPFGLIASIAKSENRVLTNPFDMTGNKFLADYCRDPNEFGSGLCIGYVMGLSDGIAVQQDLLLNKPRILWQNICRPEGVTSGQLRDVVVKYVEDHPEKRHEPVWLLAIVAMRSAWPC